MRVAIGASYTLNQYVLPNHGGLWILSEMTRTNLGAWYILRQDGRQVAIHAKNFKYYAECNELSHKELRRQRKQLTRSVFSI